MTTTASPVAAPSFQMLPVSALRFSDTKSQTERRAHFDKAAIAELAESLKALGMVQPIVVRGRFAHGEIRAGFYEVVAGERRVVAAKKAGLVEVPANVRQLTDEQVLEVQLVENLQREDLHELAEAEGYEALMKSHKYTVEQLVDKIGKSKAYVYARLKLTALCQEARSAFYGGKLNASTALLVARIPDHNLQRQAMKEIIKPNQWSDTPLSFRDAKDHIQKHYMLRLDDAPFPTGDANLIPLAGPCGSCPKRTGNQPTLFGDVKSADVCTDPICFGKKRDANGVRLASAAKASGKEVISGDAAKKIAPRGVGKYEELRGHVKLDDTFWSGSKQKSYRAAIGKDVDVKHLQDPETGKLVEIATEADVRAAMKKRGIKDGYENASGGNERWKAEQRARDRKHRIDAEHLRRLHAKIRERYPAKLGRAELALVVAAYWDRLWHETAKDVAKIWNEVPEKGKRGYGGANVKDPLAKRIPKMSETEIGHLLLDIAYNQGGTDSLLAAAKRMRIDANKVRREVVAEMAPKSKGKKKPAKRKS